MRCMKRNELWACVDYEGPDQTADVLSDQGLYFLLPESWKLQNVSMESKGQMRSCTCSGWDEATHFAHARTHFLARRGPCKSY